MKDILLSPMIYLLLVISLCLFLCAYRRYKSHYSYIFIPTVIILYLLSTPFGSNSLLHLINYTNETIKCDSDIGILLPGGLDHTPVNSTDYMAMSSETLKRSHGTINWLSSHSAINKLIVSGDGANSDYSEAMLVSNYLRNFLLDDRSIDIGFEDESETTHLSAINISKLLKQREIVLFTSSLHMRRAKMTFERIGFKVCPVVTHTDYIDKKNASSFMPDAYSDLKSKAVLHEIIGLLWYRVTNRI